MANKKLLPQDIKQVALDLEKIDDIVKRNYLRNLSSLKIRDIPEKMKTKTSGDSACLFPIKKIVYDRDEGKIFDKEKENALYDALISFRVDEFELWLLVYGEDVETMNIPTRLKKAVIDYYFNVKDDSTENERSDAFSSVAYEFFNVEKAFYEVLTSTETLDYEDLFNSLKNEVLSRLYPYPEACEDRDALFMMLALEYQKRNNQVI